MIQQLTVCIRNRNHLGPAGAFMCLFALVALTPACSNLQRSAESGYGITSPSARLQPAVAEPNARLKQLEAGLTDPRSLEQYSRWLPWFRDDNEKVFFLSLPTVQARQAWVAEQDIPGRAKRISQELKAVIEAKDIALGMTESMVKQSWGEPEVVEVSGEPAFRNSRWKYNRQIATPDGFRTEKRTVYIEGGKVSGWDTE